MAENKTKKTKAIDPEAPVRLRALRKAMELTQDNIAELGGLPRDAMPRIERGHRLQSFPIRQALARAFRLTLDQFTAYIEGTLTLEEVRRLQGAFKKVHGDLPGWAQAEADARVAITGTAPHEFMGARLMPVLRPPNGPIDVTYVLATAWIFRGSATEEELRQAIEEERRERPTSSVPPPMPKSKCSLP